MIESNDWMMTQINLLAKFLASVFSTRKKNKPIYENDLSFDEDSFEFERLLENLISEDKINEAEDLLFERLEDRNYNDGAIAVRFYQKLQELDDKKLEKSDYTREEILQGLEDLAKSFGLNLR